MSVSEILIMIVLAIWLFLPAMLPNSAAVVFGGGTPVDFGRSWKGKRILGDGKTWRGFIGGGLAGVALGLILIGISSFFDPSDYWGFGSFWSNVGVLFCLAFGSLLGDMGGSFLKRRLGIERGQKAPVLDQFDFVIGAFIITSIFYPYWVYNNYIEGWHILGLVVLLVLIFFLHHAMNIIGYKAGLKDEPW